MKKVYIYAGIVAVLIIGAVSFFGQKNLGDSALPNLFNSGTNGSVAVASATSTVIMAPNGIRQFASICNDGANVVYLTYGVPATLSKGIRLATATCFEINNTKGYTGAINGIATTSTSTVTTIEK